MYFKINAKMTKMKKLLPLVVLLLAMNSFSQSVTEITTKKGIRYITTTIDYPITGTYMFQGAEPIVQLEANGTGIYQLHELPKKAMVWGIECNQSGEPIFKKGFDNAAYTLWYQYTTSTEDDTDKDWKEVEFSIHFNSSKMFIQGERAKDFTPKK
jgi:hypothetical protein